MLYTKRGDNGTTKLFSCPPGARVSKSDIAFEALGTVDELNCMLGYAKTLCRKTGKILFIKNTPVSFEDILENIQQILFSLQAELAGSLVRVKQEHILYLENIVFEVETVLPPIKSFIICGGGEVSACLDWSRAVARRAERLVVWGREKQKQSTRSHALKFLNRLSSALYALARHANYEDGYTEKKPEYK